MEAIQELKRKEELLWERIRSNVQSTGLLKKQIEPLQDQIKVLEIELWELKRNLEACQRSRFAIMQPSPEIDKLARALAKQHGLAREESIVIASRLKGAKKNELFE